MKYDLDQKYIKFIENDVSKEADILNRIRIINFLIHLEKFIEKMNQKDTVILLED